MMRRIKTLLAASLVVTASPAMAQHKDDEGYPLALVLSCGVGDEATGGYLALEGKWQEENKALATLQLFDQDQGGLAAPWPADGKTGPSQFFNSTSFGPEGAFTDIRFERDGQTWHLYSFTGPWKGDEPQDGAGGLAVVDKAGKLLWEQSCSERIMIYFDVLEETTACDSEGPLGAAACTGEEVTRTKPLAELYPWLAEAAPGALVPSTD
jgi:hypothetical protein